MIARPFLLKIPGQLTRNKKANLSKVMQRIVILTLINSKNDFQTNK